MGAGQVLSIVVFAVIVDGLAKMVRFGLDNPASDEVPPGVGQMAAASTASALISPLSLIGIVLLLIWLHRAVTNGVALGHRGPREPALAVVAWFIPIVNFWWPYESLRECVRPTDVRTRALIKRWWLTYLAAGFGFLVVTPVVALSLPVGVVLGAGAVAVIVHEVRLTLRVADAVLADHTFPTQG